MQVDGSTDAKGPRAPRRAGSRGMSRSVPWARGTCLLLGEAGDSPRRKRRGGVVRTGVKARGA